MWIRSWGSLSRLRSEKHGGGSGARHRNLGRLVPFQLLVEAVSGCIREQKVPRCLATPVSGPEAVNRTEGPDGR